MAEGYKHLGEARRRVIRRDKKTRSIAGGLDALSEVLDTTAGVLTFAGGQMKKQDTAWKEYEAGYEALGGDVADIPKRPGFLKQVGQTLMPGGDKGFYEMPEGEVQIDDRMFDREKIQEAGSFLGTDAAAALYSQQGGDDARKRYLERVVPGKPIEQQQRTRNTQELIEKIPKDQSTQSVVRTPQEELQLEENRKITEQQLKLRREGKTWEWFKNLNELQQKEYMNPSSNQGSLWDSKEINNQRLSNPITPDWLETIQ